MNKFVKTFNTILFALAFTLFALTFSIALPLFIREFYYWHIDLYDLTSATGYTKEEIIYSFNELMDCLMFFKTPFSEGVFKFSDSGMNHFLDCQILFVLDYTVLGVSFLIILAYLILSIRKKDLFYHPFNLTMSFIFMTVLILALLVFGIFALIDVDAAFEFFHKIFFPGKSNWIFYADKDPIIRAMPEEFFINCAILIFSSFIFIYILLIIYNIIRKIKYGSNRVYIGGRQRKCLL